MGPTKKKGAYPFGTMTALLFSFLKITYNKKTVFYL